ncbi:HisA/HisF-related TIM barrel protein, partial [Pseudoalteromonas sp. 45-MNA-CIBAN-0466]
VNEGARRLHLVDLNGAFDGVPVHKQVVNDIAKAFPQLPIQLGGGVRNMNTIEQYITAGLTYIIIGTKAVEDPNFVAEACREFAGHI